MPEARVVACRAAIFLAAMAGAPALAAPPWPEFQIIVWQGQTEAAYAGLKKLGVTAGMAIANRDDPGGDLANRTAALRGAGLPWYVENIATDFYAAYHRYVPGQPINAAFLEAQRRWRADPSDPTAFYRNPSLADPVWIARVRDRLRATVRAHEAIGGATRPLFYDLGDETGIADLTAAWDFDRSPASLAGMRMWLAERYPSLAALNAEWNTDFARWEDVTPMTTAQALQATDDNFASWSDFKAWMDESFARAVRAGTDAVHEADPHALAAIEGAQRPGPGGYDYSRLAGAVDVMEIYPDDDNLEMAASFNSALTMLATSASDDDAAHRAIWEAVLRGTRGLVLWDEARDIVLPDGRLGPRGALAAPLFAQLHGSAVAALLEAVPVYDPVAILYSPESDRVQWLRNRRAGGRPWPERDADIENEDTAIRASRRRITSALLHHGVRPRWVTEDQLSRGALPAGTKVLVLPETIALSDEALAAIRRFVAAGGLALADGRPGLFDGHGRRRSAPVSAAQNLDGRLPADWLTLLTRAAGSSGVTVTSHGAATQVDDVAIRNWSRGADRVVALFSDVPSDPTQSRRIVDLHLPAECVVTDLASGARVGVGRVMQVTLEATRPLMLEIAQVK